MQCCIIEELEGEMPRPARWEFSDHTSNAGLECTVTKVVSFIFAMKIIVVVSAYPFPLMTIPCIGNQFFYLCG